MATSYIENTDTQLRTINRKILYQAGGIVNVPFQVALTDHDDVLTCHQVLRVIPKKRLLAFGKWGDKEVAVKMFYEKRRAKRAAFRDASGIEILMQANVPTAKLLYKGTIDHDRIHILIFEKINDGAGLGVLWRKRAMLADIDGLLEAVTLEIATQHVLGIQQHDLHLNNFLITEKSIYTIDGGRIESSGHPLDKQTSIENLSLFLIQFGVDVDGLSQRLFDIYTKSRGWLVKPEDVKLLKKCLSQLSLERMQKYKKKIFRDCAAFKRIDKLTKTLVYDRSHDSLEMQDLLKNPDTWIESADAVVLKSGRSSTVVKLMVAGKPIVVKRYNIKNTWHGMRRALRATRARKSWCIAQQCYVSGIATPKPIAYIENHFLGLHGKSYFIMEYVDGLTLGDFFKDPLARSRHGESVALSVCALFKGLSELRMKHGDLKMTNIIVQHQTPHLIDFDGVIEQVSGPQALKSDVDRFMQNWEQQPEVKSLFETYLHTYFT